MAFHEELICGQNLKKNLISELISLMLQNSIFVFNCYLLEGQFLSWLLLKSITNLWSVFTFVIVIIMMHWGKYI